MEETPEERQKNELAALQAIFGTDVVDKRDVGAWKIWQPLNLTVMITPLHNSDVRDVSCVVQLEVKCCRQYPLREPNIAILKADNLSAAEIDDLINQLNELASRRCGEEVIFELVQHVQQYLHDHVKVQQPTLSCYEEMMKQKEEMELLQLQDLQIKENERQKIQEEIQKRQEMLRGADRRVHRSSVSQDSNDNGQGDAPELVFYADVKTSPPKNQQKKDTEVVCNCNAKGAQILRITQRNNKKVYIGNCLGHSLNGSTTFLAIDDETGERLITKKWLISATSDFQTRNRQMTALQQDLKTLCRIKHSYLVPYLAMETVKETKRTAKQAFYIFRDYVQGCSLKYILNKCRISDRYEALKFMRSVALGVFNALKELHSYSVVHRDVRSENVFLDDSGGVKLVGAALDTRLAEMHEGDSYCSRQTSSQDIYAAAQLLLSIVCLESATTELPRDMPSTAKDFFSRCLTEEEHTQWTAEQLVTHAFLVDAPSKQPQRELPNGDGSGSDDDEVKKIHHLSPPSSGHSRLNAEFEVLTWLGKGAFGDVLKVKNKLDGGFYAIKRIKLNPESVQLNRKITREVKLLSRLNHENVVRYYNAWIESTVETVEDEEVTAKSPARKKPNDSLMKAVAKLGQEVKVEWSISEQVVQRTQKDSSDSEDEIDDEQDPWFNIMKPEEESSSGIEFEVVSNQSETIPSEMAPETPRPQSVRLHQVLYIQMEFCEKHTLRQAIDNGLFREQYRAWRLFREIVEGLAHVHQRGMIHRDLKPVNIFLDSNDHVKIGDFGLATKAFTGLPVEDKLKHPEDISGSMTGQVGTALYVAPELIQAVGKVIYNQKVDIYSLGIILFEMFHPPLNTGMERMLVLTELRTKDIVIPSSFKADGNVKQTYVIRWLLNHDPSVRPTCAELLASEHVPRPVPEGALSGLLAHTLSDRGARCYQRLISACLDQKLSAAEDFTYHGETRSRPLEVLEAVKDIVIKVFKSHGAIEFSPPLLMPRSKCWDQYPNAVKVMTSSGAVCHLPHDLRLPFARHIAYSGTKYMRRYVVDRVYREKHVQGFHPREIIECAFDIVNPKNDSLWSDAELMMVAWRCASETSPKVMIQINHTQLLRNLLLSCGVPLDKHADMYPVLVDVRLGRMTSLQLQTHLTSLCVTDRDLSNLVRLMEADIGVYETRELVTSLVKQAQLSKQATKAAAELETVYRNARAFGCECQISVAPFLAYNAMQHSGVFWQMSVVRSADAKGSAKNRAGDIIAAGGRYDVLLEEFWKVAYDKTEMKITAVGFSLSLERMAALLKKEPELPPAIKHIEESLVCVCVWGAAGSGREGVRAGRGARLAGALWAGRAACCTWPAHAHDAHDHTRAAIVLLHDDEAVRVFCWGNDRVREHKVPYIDAVDFVKQKLSPELTRSLEGSSSRTISWNENDKSSNISVSVTFVTDNERMTKNSKRHWEQQIGTQVTSLLLSLGLCARTRVCVVALASGSASVRSLAAALVAPLDPEKLASVAVEVANSFPKQQSILEEAMTELALILKQNSQSRLPEEIQLYALYSLPDSFVRLIT